MVWEGEFDGKKPGVLGTGELWSNRQAIKLYLQVVCLISTYFYNGEIYLLRRGLSSFPKSSPWHSDESG